MPQKITAIAVLLSAMCLLNAHAADKIATPVTHEIDADVWNVITDTVATRDIVKMGSTYLPDAVLVAPEGTKAISTALKKWGRDMVEQQAKGQTATVAFRFSRRQDDAATAFESGIAKYTVQENSGAMKSMYWSFEQLFVKKNGKWRILMERQVSDLAQADWDKLPPNDMSRN